MRRRDQVEVGGRGRAIGFNEQIFGADKQAPKVAAALVQKMHSGRENSVRAMLMAACSAGGDGGRRSPEYLAHLVDVM